MKLGELLKGEKFEGQNPDLIEKKVTHITARSGEVIKDSLFIAVPGCTIDGHNFLSDAVQRGASCLIVEKKSPHIDSKIPQIVISDTRRFLSRISSRWYGYPSRNLSLIAVTGTNGKTTTSYLIQHILNQKFPCGLIGTIEACWNNNHITTINTTPGPLETNEFLRRMISDGMKSCVMEVSSHALKQERVHGVEFKIALFTNLTRDHLDYHKTFDDYYASKKKLFTDFETIEKRIINVDDPFGKKLSEEVKKKNPVTYSIETESDYRAEDIDISLDGTRFTLIHRSRKYKVSSPLMCRHNIYNTLSAIAVCAEMGMEIPAIIKQIAEFEGVPGRLESFPFGNGALAFVDYAHTPDAMINILQSIHTLKKGRLITVFGCGGNRDRDKRAMMGRIAADFSDLVIVTSDNPREEKPENIISDILSGISHLKSRERIQVIENRRDAIHKTLDMAKPGDIVAILGKGHEDYQIIGKNKYKFSDQEEIREWIRLHKAPLRLKNFQSA